MSKPEPKPVKTPTLAELRKLAKRKDVDVYFLSATHTALIHTPTSVNIMTASRSQTANIAFAALSALPDKETK